MPHEPRPRPVRTTAQVLADQERQTARGREQQPAAAKPATAVAAAAKPSLPAAPDNRTPLDRYLDEVSPATMVGRQIKSTKEHLFVTPDDGEPIPDTVDFVALVDQTMVGRIKFNGEGSPPTFRMGLLYDGFVPPTDAELPDRDQATWQIGLDGRPQDPWAHFMYLVLQRGDTAELFTYTTNSVTGRRAAGNLLKHYNRLRKTHPDFYPIVRLKEGGFNHRDERVGWVRVPVFQIVGRHPVGNVSKPDSSLAAYLNDEIPGF